MAPESEDTDKNSTEQSQQGALVPLYGAGDIVPGVQAFRRGDIILYTVRGEPEVVGELMGLLDKEGVDEVVAFISHRTGAQVPQQEEDIPDEETE